MKSRAYISADAGDKNLSKCFLRILMIVIASQQNSGASLNNCNGIACQQISATAMVGSLSQCVWWIIQFQNLILRGCLPLDF